MEAHVEHGRGACHVTTILQEALRAALCTMDPRGAAARETVVVRVNVEEVRVHARVREALLVVAGLNGLADW